MSMHESRGRLSKAIKELSDQWRNTAAGWDDARAREFETKYLLSLQQDVRQALSAMDGIAPLLQQAKRDCE